MFIIYFLSWTFCLYWIHRVVHNVPYVKKWHWDHHSYIVRHGSPGWHWNNLFLYNDTWRSTLDLYTTEVIPTAIFSWVTGQWWIFMFYYIWAAFFQQILEHHKNIDLPLFTSGKWHLIHHRHTNKNYSLFLPIWDIVFRTYKHVDQRK
jgi:sterol desaturase/sphingolipid hydroxylase (fatty acid hydroxylase superfamily)